MQPTQSLTRSSQQKLATPLGLERGHMAEEDKVPAYANQTFKDRYRRQACVGHGAFGTVYAAVDMTHPFTPEHLSCDTENLVQWVAIKEVPIHQDASKLELSRLLREIKVLSSINHENIVAMQDMDCSVPAGSSNGCARLVCNLMDTNLSNLIRSQQTFSDTHVQFFIYQVLRALKYLHSAHIVHRDIKPSNCLVNANCDLQLCDFGLSRYIGPTSRRPEGMPQLDFCVMSNYVATRWYRAPEIILGKTGAHKTPFANPYGVDMWATGCVLAELILRRPLFPGDNDFEQHCLVQVLKPNDSHAQRKAALQRLFQRPVSPLALDLIACLLHPDPLKRPSADEALRHPYIQNLHDPSDEPVFHGNLAAKFDFEDEILSRSQLLGLLRRSSSKNMYK